MSADDTTDGSDDPSEDPEGRTEDADAPSGAPGASSGAGDDAGIGVDGTARSRREGITERLSEETDRAVEEFDQRLVDLLSWMLDTETRARIYVHLRQAPNSTSDEIAERTGLYPSTVREALAELHDEGIVERRKRESEGAGNNPFEYAAIAPSELVGTVAERVQNELNTVFNLDSHVRPGTDRPEPEDEPVTITVEDESDVDTDESNDLGDGGADESGDQSESDDHSEPDEPSESDADSATDPDDD